MKAMVSRRIVWAIDPFCDECTLIKRTARAVRLLALRSSAEVEPVYLLGGFPPDVRLFPALMKDIQGRSESELSHLVRGIAIPRLKPIHVIEDTSSQLRQKVDRLVDYAKEKKADMIAVGTRARKGPKRWFLGSFAETLISRSDVPLFIINPNEASIRKLSHILFPTDFSKESESAFEEVIQLAKEIGARITVFHKISYELNPVLSVALSAYPPYIGISEEDVKDREKLADQLAKSARDEGVETEILIDYRIEGSIVRSILHCSKVRGGFIAMAAHSGPLASAVLGSTTRQVVRSSICPVWVIHTEQRKKSKIPVDLKERDVMSDLIGHGRGKESA